MLQAQQPPPPLPEYTQPPCPAPGYIWTPGYWSYAPQGYYWVPGGLDATAAAGLPVDAGFLGIRSRRVSIQLRLLGPAYGYYGGINYGYGYTGMGYQGGYWNNNRFYYNRSVNNVNVTNITNVYNRTVINNTTLNRVSYNGARRHHSPAYERGSCRHA